MYLPSTLVCMHTYTHTDRQTNRHTLYTYATYIRTSMHACILAIGHICMHTYIRTLTVCYLHADIHACMRVRASCKPVHFQDPTKTKSRFLGLVFKKQPCPDYRSCVGFSLSLPGDVVLNLFAGKWTARLVSWLLILAQRVFKRIMLSLGVPKTT